jgi:ATP-dependent Clp protease ATP-binding subunit ClpA
LGRKQEATERPLHRSPALRKIFKQAASLASADGGSLRSAHLLVALIESGDTVVSAAVTKLGHDSFAVLRKLRQKISRQKTEDRRREEEGCAGHRGGG